MKLILQIIAVVMVGVLGLGCATGLNSMQKQEYMEYQANGLLVEEKSPGTAAALGILPGGGSFYTRNYGLGIVNLLLWPISILWDPISGQDGAESINYYATKSMISYNMGKESRNLESMALTNRAKQDEHLRMKRTIEQSYSTDFKSHQAESHVASFTSPTNTEILIPRSSMGDKGKYYLLETTGKGSIIRALHKRVGVDGTGFTFTEINCATLQMRELGYSEQSPSAIKESPTDWFPLLPGSSKSDLVNFVCNRYALE